MDAFGLVTDFKIEPRDFLEGPAKIGISVHGYYSCRLDVAEGASLGVENPTKGELPAALGAAFYVLIAVFMRLMNEMGSQ